ncbi:head-tail adaptor protein [Streptomyces sp. NPDC006638]|uniref:phage head completion protein n=1 Tax=Streptomyces sp. NPDC006638 TaxID=3157183 RepID=UPI0033A28FA8
MTDTVVVVRPGPSTRDTRGNVIPGPPTETPVPWCAVLPPTGQTAPTMEITQSAQTVTVVRVLYAPMGTDLRPADKVRFDGKVYEVIGEPSPFNRTTRAHIEANLKAVSG